MTEMCWSWLENLFRKLPTADYRLVSGLAGIITLFVFLLFSFRYESFSFDRYRAIMIASISILIAIEPSGIVYFIFRIKQIIKIINFNNTDEQTNLLLQDLNDRFTKSRFYKLLILLVVVPFIAMDTYGILKGETSTFWDWEKTTLSLIFTIFYYLIGYFLSFLLANVIWILINFSFFLNKLAKDDILSKININIFCGFKVGLLNQARDLLMKLSGYYFICVAFATLSYVSPAQQVSYQMIFYICIDLLGVLIFLWGWLSIQKIFRHQWQKKVIEIDDLYNDNYNGLTNLISKKSKEDKELKKISTTLDILQKQRDRLSEIIKGDTNPLDMLQVFCSFLITVLAFAQKFFDIFKVS